MQNPQWLAIGLSTLISGTLTSVALSATNPTLPIAASTTGAIGVSLFTKRKEDRMKEETLQHNEQLRQNNEQLRHSNEQLRHNIANLESLLAKYPATLTATETPVIQQNLASATLTAAETPVIQQEPPKTETKNEPVETIVEQENNSNAIAWLKARQLTVNSYHQHQEIIDEIAQKISLFLGDRYSILQPLYSRIKSRTSMGGSFTFKLSNKSKEEIDNCTRFCQLLDNHSFLIDYRYSSKTKTITATPQTNNKFPNFLTGGWFEWFVCSKVCNLLESHKINYEVLMNVKGNFSNGNDYELDLLFLIDDRPLWIECKTGECNAFFKQYGQYRKILGIPKERTFLVGLELSDSKTVESTAIWDITVANLNTFIQQIEKTLNLSLDRENQPNLESSNYQEIQANNPTFEPSNDRKLQPNNQILERPSNTVFKILNKKSLRPSPKYRKQVIEQIVKLFAESDCPSERVKINYSQICEEIHQKLSISKNKIDEIIRALIRSQSFLDDSGKPIAAYKDPIAKLVSSDCNVLNQKCIELYRKAMLESDPNFFDNPKNVKEFNDTVG